LYVWASIPVMGFKLQANVMARTPAVYLSWRSKSGPGMDTEYIEVAKGIIRAPMHVYVAFI